MFLFAGSIAENICFFDTEPDRGKIERCSRLAMIHEEISAMPMGYETLIGDMGSALSGGQKHASYWRGPYIANRNPYFR